MGKVGKVRKMNEEFVKNIVMNEEFVKNIVMNDKIDPKGCDGSVLF